jgi:hypothetical protein
MSDNVGRKYCWKPKPFVTVDIAPPVQSQWYDVVDLKGGVKIHTLKFFQTQTEAGELELALEITVDGVVTTLTASCESGKTNYLYNRACGGDWGYMTYTDSVMDSCFCGPTLFDAAMSAYILSQPYECGSFKVRVRLNDAVGTNQALGVYVTYSKLEAV